MKEAYRPSVADIERLKPKADMLKVSGDRVFATLQGEGVTAGLPSVFLRLHYCNLTCGLPIGWKCDTTYTWDSRIPEFWKEPEDWSYVKAASLVEEAWDAKFGDKQERRLVVTGGEPLIQQRKLAKLLELLRGWRVEIETNGTITPIPVLQTRQFNCSPKLENSGNNKARRYNPSALRAINALPNSWFKFVVSDISDLDEIGEIVRDCGLNEDKLLIMPEGQTADVVEGHAQLVRDAVNERGWKITMRNQLIWYGDKRRT